MEAQETRTSAGAEWGLPVASAVIAVSMTFSAQPCDPVGGFTAQGYDRWTNPTKLQLFNIAIIRKGIHFISTLYTN